MDTELTEEQKTNLRKTQADLMRLLEALSKLDKSEEWNVLKELVFDKSVASIERQLLSESLNETIETNKLYKLQGELAWAKRYSDVNRLADTLKTQLKDIKNRLS
jgi:hypothetical protein